MSERDIMNEVGTDKLVTKTLLKAFGDKCKQIFCSTGSKQTQTATRLVAETNLAYASAVPLMVVFEAALDAGDSSKLYDFKAFVTADKVINISRGSLLGGFGVFNKDGKLALLFELPEGFTLAKVYVSSYSIADLENTVAALRIPAEGETFECSPYINEFEEDIKHTEFVIDVEGANPGTKRELKVDNTEKQHITKVYEAYQADQLSKSIAFELTGDVTGTATLAPGNESLTIATICSKGGDVSEITAEEVQAMWDEENEEGEER